MMKMIWKRMLAVTLACAMLTSSASALTTQEVLDLLDLYYLDSVPAASRELETVEEVLASLGDPYTVYMPATDYENFLSGVDGSSVVGIGVMIHQVQDKGVEIISVLPDSPAVEEGMVAGDCIIAVDGVEVTSVDHAQELISGEEGTELELTISTQTGEIREISCVRRTVAIPIVTYELIDGVPYINCSSFGDSTADTVRAALEEYINWDTPYIMDLQQNPGGLDKAVAMTGGWFLGSSVICYYLNNQNQLSRLAMTAATPDFTDQPLILLTSGYSSSGAEMLAGAIRSYDAGIAIGARTYGKGVAQKVFDEGSYPELFDGDSVKITYARFFSFDGATNDVVGILPTLSIATGYVTQVAVLLSSAQPESPEGFLKLELGGSTFYVDVEKGLSEDYLPAFQELLESLALTQPAYLWLDGAWLNLGGEAIASYLGVDYESRNYTDVSASPYVNQLSGLAVHGILPCGTDGSFSPSQEMTREEFAHMLAYALQLRVVEGAPFADVSADNVYSEAITALYAKGMVQGDEHGNFNPDALITYQEAVTMLSNAAQWISLEAKSAALVGFSQEELEPYTSYSSWARASAAVLDTVNALLKDTTPETVQKDEAGAMIYKLLEGTQLLWN